MGRIASRGRGTVDIKVIDVYQSNRLERLVDALAEVLEDPPASPLDREWIAVQSQGMRDWLGAQLARRLGVLANTWMPFPRTLVDRVTEIALGEGAGERGAFRLESLAWSVFAILPEHLDHPELEPLAAYVEGDPTGIKRYQLATRIARAFDEYALYRPETALCWSRAPDDGWQSILWHALVRRHGEVHAAAAAAGLLDAIRSGAVDRERLPRRVSLFGISSLPPVYVEILSALSDLVDVGLYLLDPSRRNSKTAFERAARGGAGAVAPEGPDAEAVNPLLASLGRTGRELREVIAVSCGGIREPAADSLYEDPVETGPRSALAAVQSDILDDVGRPSPGAPRLSLAAGDRSISIHSCHGRMREVEVLRDQLLAMFDDPDLDLRPDRVLVAAPDMGEYAPFVEAVFGASDGGAPAIPFHVAGRSPGPEGMAIDALLALLDAARGRMEADEVIDLLARDPIRTRFELGADGVDLARSWILDAGVRWGIDEDHRAAAGQPAYRENTWRFGLDRLLLGHAMPGGGWDLFAGVLPCEAAPKDAEVLGRLVSFCEALFEAVGDLGERRSAAGWRDLLVRLLDRFVADPSPDGAGRVSALEAVEGALGPCEAAGLEEPLDLAVVRAALSERVAEGDAGRGLLSRGVAFCDALPLRGVPFDAVCLLGMSDGAFPRSSRAPQFDLVAREPRAGDRSVRSDDEQVFLESLLAARRRLLITYQGRGLAGGRERPPSVVVEELIDAVCEGFFPEGMPDDGPPRETRDRIVVRHPMHPFGRAYFDGSDDRLFSYSASCLEAARAALGGPAPPRPFLSRPLPPDSDGEPTVSVEEICRFFRMPCLHFLRRRLGVHLPDEPEGPAGREPMEMGELDWSSGEDLLEEVLRGSGPWDPYPALRARGALPLGAAGRAAYRIAIQGIGAAAEKVHELGGGETLPPLDLDLDLGGARLIGRLSGLRPGGQILYRWAKVRAEHRLDLWIRHLALLAARRDGDPEESAWVGKPKKGKVEIVRLGPIEADPREILSHLVGLYMRGLSEPLRLFPHPSLDYATTRRKAGEGADRSGLEKARKAWDEDLKHRNARTIAAERIFSFPGVFEEGGPDAPDGFRALSLAVLGPYLDAEGAP